MVNRITHPALVALLLATAAVANASEPLDFNYRIAGDAKVRPVLVFNDGSDVFIQPNPETSSDIKIVGANADKEGPYFVIRGLTSSFSVQMKKGGTAEVSYKGSRSLKPIVPESTKPVTTSLTPAGKQGVPDIATPSTINTNDVTGPTKKCEPQTDRKESAFIVAFKGSSVSISTQAVSQLKHALADSGFVTSVDITAESETGNVATAAKRLSAIRDIVEAQGIDKAKINAATREATGIGSEIRIVREHTLPCVARGVTVSYRDIEHVTIASRGDAKKILGELAQEAGLSFQSEGKEVSIPIMLAEINKPLVTVLEAIGNRLGEKADVIYRGKTIVLSYRGQK